MYGPSTEITDISVSKLVMFCSAGDNSGNFFHNCSRQNFEILDLYYFSRKIKLGIFFFFFLLLNMLW